MVDESTDIGTQSNMCVVVRFYKIWTWNKFSHFWDLVPVYDINNPEKVNEGATLENLFECIIKSFEKYNINIQILLNLGQTDVLQWWGRKIQFQVAWIVCFQVL